MQVQTDGNLDDDSTDLNNAHIFRKLLLRALQYCVNCNINVSKRDLRVIYKESWGQKNMKFSKKCL